MTLWHQTGDAPCLVSFGDGAWWLDLKIGTWPVEAGQPVSVEAMVSDDEERVRPAILCGAVWKHNKGGNSYWNARLGPFKAGDNVEYSLKGKSADGQALHQMFSMHIGPKLLLAILWHQHQPMYRHCGPSAAKGSFSHSFPQTPLRLHWLFVGGAGRFVRPVLVHLWDAWRGIHPATRRRFVRNADDSHHQNLLYLGSGIGLAIWRAIRAGPKRNPALRNERRLSATSRRWSVALAWLWRIR